MIRQSMKVSGAIMMALVLMTGAARAQQAYKEAQSDTSTQGQAQQVPQQLSGTVMRSQDVRVRTILLQTQDGERLIVALGPELQGISLQQGTQLQAQGQPMRIGGQLVLLAQHVTADGQTVEIDRPEQHVAQQDIQHQQAGAQWEHPQVSTINVTPPSDIIGRPARDTQGRRMGMVEYILIDAQNGAVLYAIIGSGGALDIGDNLIAVPWAAVDLQRQGLKVNRSLDELKTAPQVSPERLAELTNPTLVSRIRNYYLIPTDQVEQDTQGEQRAQEQPRESQQDTQKPQNSQGSQPRILVSRDIITTFVAPALTSEQQIRGTQVEGQDGQIVGKIAKVMIDPDHGHVAYVLLEQEQFLGGQSIPIPFEALQWSTSVRSYVLNTSADKLQHMPQLPRQNLPTQVSATDIQQLYAHYAVTPYWERAVHMAKRPSAHGAAIAATVQDIDPRQGTLTLQTAKGKTVDLQVSQELLDTLQEGDRVEVTIRQPSQGQQSGMRRMSPSASEQGR